MALTAFCTVCQRTVYIDESDTPVCPVCSSPLLEQIEDPSGSEADRGETGPPPGHVSEGGRK